MAKVVKVVKVVKVAKVVKVVKVAKWTMERQGWFQRSAALRRGCGKGGRGQAESGRVEGGGRGGDAGWKGLVMHGGGGGGGLPRDDGQSRSCWRRLRRGPSRKWNRARAATACCTCTRAQG